MCKVEKVRSTFHTFHDYLNFCGKKKMTGYLPFEYSGRFYIACPVMETVDSGMMETAIPEMQNQ